MAEGTNVDVVKHLAPETVDVYFEASAPTRFRLSTRFDALLDIDPHSQGITLHVPASGELPDVATFERISVKKAMLAGYSEEWFRIDIDAIGMRYEAYTLAESVVDQIKDGATLRQALSESLEALGDLLSRRNRLTGERETGLLGELLVVQHVVDRIGEEAAMASWLGPDSGEHDFAFEDFEAEVKTTRSESRVHVIGSETQLMASPGRPLNLISIQLTLAGQGPSAFTLPQVIDQVRSRMQNFLPGLDRRLELAGWEDAARDLYRTRFQYRSRPRAYVVDGSFPAITRQRLDAVVPQSVHVRGVSYRLDVTELPFIGASAPLENFCEGEL